MTVMAVSSGGAYITLPTPAYSTYSAISNELTKADRNVQGNLVKQRIAVKGTITAEWHGLTASQKNTLLSLTEPNSFNLRYVSMMDDSVKYGNFYRGSDLSVKGYGRYDESTHAFAYYDVKCSLVEL